MKKSLEEKVKRLEAENAELKNEKKKLNHSYIVIGVIVGLCYWSVTLYRKTFVDVMFLISIILFAGILVTLMEQLGYIKSRIKNTFLALLKNIFSWGIIICSLFLILNYYVYFGKVKKAEYQVKKGRIDVSREKGSIRGVYFKIEHKRKVKKLRFPPKYFPDRYKYKSVTLDITKGLFGCEIVKKQELNY